MNVTTLPSLSPRMATPSSEGCGMARGGVAVLYIVAMVVATRECIAYRLFRR